MTENSRGPDYYRERAELMRTHAKYTSSEKGRFVYLELAAYWEQLADVSEKSTVLSESIQLDMPQARSPSEPEYGPGAPRR